MVIDLGLGGVRVYSDDRIKLGSRLEIDLFLPTGETMTCLTEVVWVQELPEGGPAKFDVGLHFLELPEADHARLLQIVDPE